MTDEQPEKREEPDEEELENRLRALLGEGGERAELPPEEADDFELKLREIEDKAESIKASSRMPEPPEWDYKRPKPKIDPGTDPSNYKGLGTGISVAYALVGCMILGFAIGWVYDRSAGGVGGQ